MPNRYPLRARAVSIVDQAPTPAERAFLAVVVATMVLISTIVALL